MENLTENYTFKSPQIQNFSIPSNIVYYINITHPNVLQKLQQTCKYFFAKNKIIVIKNGYFASNKWPLFETERDINQMYHFYARFWFTGELRLNPRQLSFIMDTIELAKVCSKIYKNDIILLKIHFAQLNLEEYEILTSSKNIKTVLLFNSTILDNDKNDVPLEILMKRIPFISKFVHQIPEKPISDKQMITNKTLEYMIIHENSVNNFGISGYTLSQNLDPNSFCSFIMSFFDIKKAAVPSEASFRFFLNYSFREQQEQIIAAVKQMLETWNTEQQKPRIHITDSYYQG